MRVCLSIFSNNLLFHEPNKCEYKRPGKDGFLPEQKKITWEICSRTYPAKRLTDTERASFKPDLKRFKDKSSRIQAYLPLITKDAFYNSWGWCEPFFYLTWSESGTTQSSDGTEQNVRLKLHLKTKPLNYKRPPWCAMTGYKTDVAEKIIKAQVLLMLGTNLITFEGELKLRVGYDGIPNCKRTDDDVSIAWNFEPHSFQSEKIVSKEIIDQVKSKTQLRAAVVGVFENVRPQPVLPNDASVDSAQSNWKIFKEDCGSDMIIVSNDWKVISCHKIHVTRNASKLVDRLFTSGQTVGGVLQLDLNEEQVEAFLLYQYSWCTELILESPETCLAVLKVAEEYEMWALWSDIVTELLDKSYDFFGTTVAVEFNTFLMTCSNSNEEATEKLKEIVKDRIKFVKDNPDKVFRRSSRKRQEGPVKSPQEQSNRDPTQIRRRGRPAKPKQKPVILQDEPVKRQIEPVQLEQEPVKRQHEQVKLQHEPVKRQFEPVQRQHEPVQRQHEPVQRQLEPVQRQNEDVALEHEPLQLEHEPVQLQPEPLQSQLEPVKHVLRKRDWKPSKRQQPTTDTSWTEALQRGKKSNKRLWKDVINKNCRVVIGPRDIVKAPGLNKISISSDLKIEKMEVAEDLNEETFGEDAIGLI